MINLKRAFLLLSLATMLTLAMLPVNIAKAQDEPLFKVTLIAPGNANMLRRQWGQIIANSLIQLGIDARVVYLSWTSVFDRVFTPALDKVGKTYDEGGFDIQLVGYAPDKVFNPGQIYYASPENWPPYGNNYYLWNNTEANNLMDIYLTTTNITERDQVAKKLQTILYNELPASIIYHGSTPTVVTPELGGPAIGPSAGGDGWLYFNYQPNPEWLTGKTSVVYASTGEIESLIPPLSFSWYDAIIARNIFGWLASASADLSNYAVPNLLTSWKPSNNGFNWTWTTRTGVKWHDGADFTADDVVFSLWALMNPETGTQHRGTYTIAFGDNVKFTYANGTSLTLGTGTRVGNVTAVNATTINIALPELLPGKPYGFFDPYLLGFDANIIPKHILEKIAPADWTDSPFNTGEGSIDIPGTPGTPYTGPIGTGPYKWVDFDPVAQLIHLEKNDDYWNKTALIADGLFGVTDYYIRYIADKTPALAALKNDEVDMLDPQYQIQADIPTIDPAWGKVLLNEGTGPQEVGYNNEHPIFGTGVDTPLGRSDPSRAAEAAKYVRTAFDYAIPRELIIENLLADFGQPAAVNWPPTGAYYNASITARPYDLAKAREYLGMAGFGVPTPPPLPTIPSFLLGMSTTIRGTHTDADGNLLANRELTLWETTDNATYETTSELIGRTTTDLSGWYSFTVTPPSTGVHYYYLFDRLEPVIGEEWKYITMLNVTSFADALDPLQDLIVDNSLELQTQNDTLNTLSSQIDALQNSVNTMTYVAGAALVVAVAVGAIAVYTMIRKKP